MDITISGQHFELTPAIRTYAEEKLTKLAHHLDNIMSIHVVLKVEQTRSVSHIAHADIHVKGGALNAKAEAGDMYSAIDLLVEKLNQQARKFKEKH